MTLPPEMSELLPPWHPILPVPTPVDLARLASEPDGPERFAEWFTAHQERMRLADWNENQPLNADLIRHGFQLPHWHEADLLLGLAPRTREALAALPSKWAALPYAQRLPMFNRLGRLPERVLESEFYILILLGGNRAAKSEYCARRVVETCLEHPGTKIVCTADDGDQSKENQHALVWKYLPPELKTLNGNRDPRGIYHINYSKKGGFTLEVCILPNGSSIHFMTHGQEPGKIEGWTLGNRQVRAIGGWADESLNVAWFEMFKRRCEYSGALFLWSFTPIAGMTPCIKEAVGEAETIMSLPAGLLPADRIHVPRVPAGEMPYIQLARTPGAVVMYFFTQFNPFGTRQGTFYEAVSRLCTDKPSAFVMRLAYGYTTDTSGRKFPGFTAVNIVRVEHLPEQGTIYQFIDPHGSRPYACGWFLVPPGNPPNYYLVREWPDERTYGEWAVPTRRETNDDNRKGWDGDPGPAQRPLGWGVVDYKRLFRDRERVHVPRELLDWIEWSKGREHWNETEFAEKLKKLVRYPWHRRIIRRAIDKGEDLGTLRETVRQRFMDARFANSEHAGEHGGTCLRFMFEEEQRDRLGQVAGPRMAIFEASGNPLHHGEALVTDLLAWDRNEPLVPGINSPRLYISEECTQTRWAFENFTGRAGQEGACKEWIDLSRHLAEEAPVHIEAGPVLVRGVGGL